MNIFQKEKYFWYDNGSMNGSIILYKQMAKLRDLVRRFDGSINLTKNQKKLNR